MGDTTQDTGIWEQPPPYFLAAVLTDTGKTRQSNQDAFLCLPEHGVFCVADGMGGMRDGDVASRTTVECIRNAFGSLEQESATHTFVQRRATLIAALEDANRRVQPANVREKQKRCGSTVVALLLDPETQSHAVVLHAGDSRLYRLRGTHLQQLTHDHSGATLLATLGKSAAKGMLAEELRGVVTRGIGLGSEFKFDETELDLRRDDILLLCSDGLTNMVPDNEIRAVLGEGRRKSHEAACRELIGAANTAGGLDNITVIVVRVGDIPEAVTTETADVDPDDTPVVTPTNPNMAQHLMLRHWMENHKSVAISTLAGTATVLLLWGVTMRGCRTDQEVPPTTITETVTATAPEITRETLLNELEQGLQDALRSGGWKVAQAKLDAGHAQGILNADDHSLVAHRQVAAWYALWIQAASHHFEPHHELAELRDQLTQFLQSIDPNVAARFDPVGPAHWPSDQAASASIYCAMVHELQRHLIAAVIDARDRALTHHNELVKRAESTQADHAGMHNPAHAQQREHWLDGVELLRQQLRRHIIALGAIRDLPWSGPRKADYAWTDLTAAFQALRDHEAAYYAIETAFVESNDHPRIETKED